MKMEHCWIFSEILSAAAAGEVSASQMQTRTNNQDLNDDGSSDSEARKMAKVNRVKWTTTEVKEINKYFAEFLKSKTTPGQKFCQKIIKVSKSSGGQLHRRSPPLIIKKISNMNKK